MPKTKEKSIKHTHKFMQVNGKFIKIWRCVTDDCKFFVHDNQKEILIGRASYCWHCGNQMTMDSDALKMEMPECKQCRLASQINQPLVELEKLIDAKLKDTTNKSISKSDNEDDGSLI